MRKVDYKFLLVAGLYSTSLLLEHRIEGIIKDPDESIPHFEMPLCQTFFAGSTTSLLLPVAREL